MKILTAKEQLKKESEEAWKSYRIVDSKETKLGSKIFDMENRFFHNKTKLRMLKYEREELRVMASQLASYSNMLLEESKKLPD